MELPTVEVRWFRAGPCPGPVADWFHGGPTVSESERRTDEYLRLPERDDVGVKRRAGVQLDLKLRTGVRSRVALPDGLDGPVEAWTKWSFPIGPGLSVPDRWWIAVEKLRWSRFYAVSADGAAVSVPAETAISTGCAAELVELAVEDRPAWGFGFEAFGDGDLADVLAATCRAVVADTPLGDIAFGAAGAHSYPAWLQEPAAS
ncbi:MAG: hypothetical protein HKM97_13970 [Acidimicrobiia bacterium]|nr:hypothetical protein [Acidimicrobiia bacterium]